jgi:ribosomal-protein-alanine N-acetyltransferase
MALSLSIRKATPGDLAAILALERDAPAAAHWSAGQYERRLADGHLLLAESGTQLRGFLCARVAADEWEIENVVVARLFLHQGIADELMRCLIARAAKAGASRLLLEVRESNNPARRLYEKHGFRLEGRRFRYYRDPTENALLYSRP